MADLGHSLHLAMHLDNLGRRAQLRYLAALRPRTLSGIRCRPL